MANHPGEQWPHLKKERDRIKSELDKRKLAHALIKMYQTAKQREVKDYDDLETSGEQ